MSPSGRDPPSPPTADPGLDRYYGTVGPFLDAALAERGDEEWWGRMVARLEPGRVVELGCGTGRVTRLLAGGGRTVVGLDRPASPDSTRTTSDDARHPTPEETP